MPLFLPIFRATIHHMSPLELLFALLLVCVLAATGGVAVLVWNLVRRADGQAREVAELRGRLDLGSTSQDARAAELRERLSQTQSVVEGLRSALAARQSVEDDSRASLKHIENVIAGSSTRGAAGENILEEALKHLQSARTVDMEKMQSALIDIERHLDTLEGVLENRLQRAVTMLQNAYGEGKQVSARIRASAQGIQVTDASTTPPEGISTATDRAEHDRASGQPLSFALVDQVR